MTNFSREKAKKQKKDMEEALTTTIFLINTWLYPNASDKRDIEKALNEQNLELMKSRLLELRKEIEEYEL